MSGESPDAADASELQQDTPAEPSFPPFAGDATEPQYDPTDPRQAVTPQLEPPVISAQAQYAPPAPPQGT
jgi:hypothetical protein